MSDQLVIHFEGWFQCRLSTDPDPTWEPRGVSGYTRAVGRESDFDRVIHLQKDGIPPRDYRTAETGNPANHVGVSVTAAAIEDERGTKTPVDALRGAAVRFERRPQYILWNQIVGDGVERLIPLIVPFQITIEKDPILLSRYDPLVPGGIGDRFWDTGDPKEYVQRLAVDFVHLSSEVMESSGISDFNGYFQRRKEWLQLAITDTTDPIDREALQVRLQALIAASETSDPAASPGLLENRLGLQTIWDHPIRGEARIEGTASLGGEVLTGPPDDPSRYWHTRFWHGAWDGDLLRGLMKGSLRMPFARQSS